MANVLLIPSWVRKDHFLEIAYALRTAGHDVTYASYLDLEAGVRAHGFRFLRLERSSVADPGTGIRRALPGNWGRLQRWVARWSRRSSYRMAHAQRQGLPGLIPQFKRLKPDIALIDAELPGPLLAAVIAGTRVAAVSTILSLWKRRGLPPLHRELAPPPGDTTGRRGFEIAWLRFRAWKLFRRVLDYTRRAGNDRVSMLRQFAVQNDLRWGDVVDPWQWSLPFSYRRMPLIDLNARELDFPHQPHPDARFVGPVICRRRVNTHDLGDEERTRLDALIRECRSVDGGRLLYCSFGRFPASYEQSVLENLMSALRKRAGWTLLMGLGGAERPTALAGAPGNVHIFDWLPQLSVLEHVDCAIIHAGMSSINECIYNEVPMVLYPLPLNDQPGNAARIAWHGLGIRACRESDSEDDILRHVELALSSEKIRTRLREMRRRFQTYAENDAVVATIEEILRNPHVGRSAS